MPHEAQLQREGCPRGVPSGHLLQHPAMGGLSALSMPGGGCLPALLIFSVLQQVRVSSWGYQCFVGFLTIANPMRHKSQECCGTVFWEHLCKLWASFLKPGLWAASCVCPTGYFAFVCCIFHLHKDYKYFRRTSYILLY